MRHRSLSVKISSKRTTGGLVVREGEERVVAKQRTTTPLLSRRELNCVNYGVASETVQLG